MEISGRWLPDGLHVERADAGRLRLRGGDHDGKEFESVSAVREYIRRHYPDLEVPRD